VDTSQEPLVNVAELLGVSVDAFAHAFQTMHLGTIESTVGANLAEKFLTSLAKTIYNSQFEWLVDSISGVLQEEDPRCALPSTPFIGVLDIFGFEYVLPHNLNPPKSMNSFEQFCINLCNEKLQELFVKLVIELDQKMYIEEGVGEVEIDFKTNNDTVTILEGNTNSVAAQLDNVATTSVKDLAGKKDWDMTFFENLGKLAKDKRHNANGRVRIAGMKEYLKPFGDRVPQGGFFVDHYAANVLYDPQGWNAKNTDKISSDIKEMMATSSTPYLANIFDAMLQEKKPATTLKFFKNKLNILVNQLSSCNTGFVRCIKSNREKKPNIYTADLVLTQLAYTGMLSTLQIQKGGYSSRIPKEKFTDIFRVLDVNADGCEALVASIEGQVQEYIDEMKFKPPEKQQEKPIHVGTKKFVLTRDWLYREMKKKADRIKGESAVTIQAVYRGVVYAEDYGAKYKATLDLLPIMRGTIRRCTYMESKWEYLQTNARSQLHDLIRATSARQQYYKERQEEFETINRHDIQRFLYATMQRQRFYEKKEKFFEHEILEKERARFEIYEGFTEEMNQELETLAEEAEEERKLMLMEELYKEKLEDADFLNKLGLAKEEEETVCHDRYYQALDAYERFQRLEEEHERLAHHTATGPTEVRLMQGAEETVRTALIERGITPNDGKVTFGAPALKELPVDRENVTEMRGYYYGSSAIAMHKAAEQAQLDSASTASPPMMAVVNDATDRILAGRLMLSPTTARGTKFVSSTMTSNVDPKTLSPRAREAFQNQIAELLSVDPRHIKLSASP